ncbi:MAG TPA: tetratricopeptide repeat protein [Chthoniobacterales bacterium]
MINPQRRLSPALILAVAAAVVPLRAQDASPSPEPEIRRAQPIRTPFPSPAPQEPQYPRALPYERPAPQPTQVQTPAQSPTPFSQQPAGPIPTPIPLQPSATPQVIIGETPQPSPGQDEEGSIRIAPRTGSRAGTTGAAADQLDSANGLYSRRMYDLAAPQYEKFLANYPNDNGRQSALFRLGECYRALGNTPASVNCYRQIVSEYTSGEFLGAASYRLAEAYYGQRRYDEAITLYRRAAVNAVNADLKLSARYYEARCLEETGRRAEARLVFQDILAIEGKNPFRIAARLAVAKYAEDTGNPAEALAQYEKVAAETDRNELRGETWMRAANMAAALKQFSKASQYYQRAIDAPGTGLWRPQARLGLMKLRYDVGDFAGAIRMFESGDITGGGAAPPELLILAANAYRQAGRPLDATSIYDQIINGFPDSPEAAEARYQRLLNLSASNDASLPAAIDDFLKQNPSSDRADKAKLLKAEYFYKNKRYPQAAKVYQETSTNLLNDTLKAECLYRAGWCYSQAEDWPNTIDAMGAFIAAFPYHDNAPKALVQRGFASLRLRAYSDAVRDFDTLINRYPKAPERELAIAQKALTQGQQEDNQAMSATFQQLLKEYPNSSYAAQAHYYIGWAAFEAKNYDGAIAPLDEARKGDPKTYFDDASIRIILSNYYLEKLDIVSREVDYYQAQGGKRGLPGEIFRWLGLKYYDKEDMAKAARYLEAHIANIPGNPDNEVYYMLGDAQVREKQWDKARKNLATYIAGTQEPGLKCRGTLALARLELAQSNYDAARTKVNEALALQPEGRLNAEGRVLTGDIEFAAGNFEAAAKSYAAVALLYDDADLTPIALEKAADAWNKAGNTSEAEKSLLELKNRFPDYKLTVGH